MSFIFGETQINQIIPFIYAICYEKESKSWMLINLDELSRSNQAKMYSFNTLHQDPIYIGSYKECMDYISKYNLKLEKGGEDCGPKKNV
jgi:hypothetical protein